MNNNKSILSFGLLLSSLVMLSAIPLLNNNAAMAQGTTIMEIVIAHTQPTITNMNVEQVH